MFPSYWEVEKNRFLAITSLTNTVAAILSEKKSGSLLFGDQKNVVHKLFRIKEKRLRHLFKVRKTGSQPVGTRKKMFPSYLGVEKTGSQLFRA